MVFSILLCCVVLYIIIRFYTRYFCSSISVILSPFIRLYIKKRIKDGLEDPKRIDERFGIPSKNRPMGDIVWIHAVSVGEVISSIPFIKIFKENNPDINILLTTTTLTSSRIVEQRLSDVVIHQFIPFDVSRWIRRFVKFWKPKAVFFVESEIWPNTLFYLYGKDIPIYLLNTRISMRSLKRMYILSKYFGILPFRLFREVFVPSEEVRGYVLDLGGQSVSIIPNMKVIAEKLPFSIEDSKKIHNMIDNRKTWICLSTHKGEEEIILSIHKKMREKINDILTIIAIRHPNRSREIIDICEDNNISYTLHSEYFQKQNNHNIETDIYIIDEIGCLGMFLDNIKTVFVGGSLIKGIGGHNIVEPLNFGCHVTTGQYIENFRDMIPYFKNVWTISKNEDEIISFIEKNIVYTENTHKNDDIEKYREQWRRLVMRISREFIY